ncbi:hypothetical protein GGX14DRAFT_563307 [Mycena pura]|uniref:Uncharacterized protein n=1 Tax=Mycena pura TaxID=153505 RepID=A0AAD6VMK6_9AGAR|nr:hypothetical protein GGX14DRAFT_563307 [Mycena pura]
MAQPIQQLALHVQNTTTHLQLASASLNALAAAPPAVLGPNGTPRGSSTRPVTTTTSLTALSLPFPRLVAPVIPPAPALGAAVNLPPPFASAAIVAPGPHNMFPVNKGTLRELPAATLATLFAVYNVTVPGQNVNNVANRRKVL